MCRCRACSTGPPRSRRLFIGHPTHSPSCGKHSESIQSPIVNSQRPASTDLITIEEQQLEAAHLIVVAGEIDVATAAREAWTEGYLLMSSIMCRAAERAPGRRAAS